MTTLHVIGEFLHSDEAAGLHASARELTLALAETAPRGCGASLLVTAGSEMPGVDHPRARVETIPLHASMLPIMWLSSATARPLDGEFLHALTPLAPLRSREEDDGSQATVTVQHTLAWDAPNMLPKGQARQFRKFTRRALKHADVIVTPTHASAERLREIYGPSIRVQVVPLATPTEFLAGDDSAERRAHLSLPERYITTNATLGEIGRLEWILRAMETNPEIPHLVITGAGAEADLSQWSVLTDRFTQVRGTELRDLGAILAGAELLLLPQSIGDCLLQVYGALSAGVPVVHGGAASIAETVLDGGVSCDSDDAFATILGRVSDDDAEREQLTVLARDRSRMFSWNTAAWQLWEIHANI